MRCEDFPCCGHEAGCCPDYDDDGRQVDMKCVCGASVPLTSHTSLCATCLRSGDDDRYDHYDERDEEPDEDEDEDGDCEPCEDFGYFGEMGMNEE
tara:strand:+ start:1586 stop:1870 length:285 start_codon:yes stop_codon:yes gene_type:complete